MPNGRRRDPCSAPARRWVRARAHWDPRILSGRNGRVWPKLRPAFTSCGPATVKDCADWSGLTMADVRHGLHVAMEGNSASWRQR
ncbi:DNA glycosylase AlkZ-like family protein [Pseudarthrobacter sp. N5]|uniref:DNA glycosylase AlkZ-like family protein n=1 Tax=Pseudarthrobacter sp. N5 TaxID=3418416 RepID=UPI003CF1166D